MKKYNEAYVVDMVNLYVRRTFIPESTEYNKIYRGARKTSPFRARMNSADGAAVLWDMIEP